MIAFICRVRDEEKTLGECLRILGNVTVPKQVVVVLDRCIDGSEAIAREAAAADPSIEVHRRSIPVSRAGLETLITPRESMHSLPRFVENAFSHARFPSWRFHIAADFVLSPELIDFLNRGGLDDYRKPTRIRLPAVTPEDGLRNCEPYLSNCLVGFGKWGFWEVPLFARGSYEVTIGLPIRHASTLGELKSYWREPPWFTTAADHLWPQARILRERYVAAAELLGPEPVGAARGSNPACDPYFRRALDARDALAERGIYFDA